MNESPTYTNMDPADRQPVLLTLAEARAVLRISNWKLYQLLRRQQIKTIYIGQRRFVPADELRAFLDRQRPGGAHDGQ